VRSESRLNAAMSMLRAVRTPLIEERPARARFSSLPRLTNRLLQPC
jgi:hypothetical protein